MLRYRRKKLSYYLQTDPSAFSDTLCPQIYASRIRTAPHHPCTFAKVTVAQLQSPFVSVLSLPPNWQYFCSEAFSNSTGQTTRLSHFFSAHCTYPTMTAPIHFGVLDYLSYYQSILFNYPPLRKSPSKVLPETQISQMLMVMTLFQRHCTWQQSAHMPVPLSCSPPVPLQTKGFTVFF